VYIEIDVRGMMTTTVPSMMTACSGNGHDVPLARRRSVQFKGHMTEGKSAADLAMLVDIEKVAVERDRAAFGRLYAFYAPRVAAYLRRVGARNDTAEDLAQEVLLSVWRRAHQFDPAKAALSTWIYTIARNKRIDALRRERHPEFDLDDPTMAPDEAPRGDTHTENEMVKEEIREAIATLPREQAELLRIFYFEDKTHSVIADELGLPLGTVKSRLRLAVAKLRGLLEGVA
jgi:RNA polymerase sigma-70 factor (ECF subfamily)